MTQAIIAIKTLKHRASEIVKKIVDRVKDFRYEDYRWWRTFKSKELLLGLNDSSYYCDKNFKAPRF
jgi:hypothetical protein